MEWQWSGQVGVGVLPAARPFLVRVSRLAWFLVAGLVLLSLAVNLLGIAVDFNEHFLRLASNDDFVFNWAHFPPLAHWQILQEGRVDLIWLRSGPAGLVIAWDVLLPALGLLGLSAAGLILAWRQAQAGVPFQKRYLEKPTRFSPSPPSLRSPLPLGEGSRVSDGVRANPKRFPVSALIPGHPLVLGLALLAALLLTFLVMRGTARLALAETQAQADLAVLSTLNKAARPGDVLLVPMPPFGDVQEVTTRLLAYLEPPLPVYAWIESEPRALQPEERERVWPAALAGAGRVWLFERWLTQEDALWPTAARLNRVAFPLQEQWFEGSGRLSLYALADPAQPVTPVPVHVPFTGGLSLVDFTVLNGNGPAGPVAAPGDILKLRLTWQAGGETPAAAGSIVVFAQLLTGTTPAQKVAQQDRLLVDLQNIKASPLRPNQTLAQGYGLPLPEDLPPGAYPLIAGLYQAGSGQRLPRADGSPEDFLYLTTVQVKK